MRVLCFIDSLGSGGAQRQLATLAVGLKKRGHEVRFLVYHRQEHFLPLLQAAEIPCELIPPCSHWRRVLKVRSILRRAWQDVVLSFLEGPSLYAELARIPRQHWGLVVGERLADPSMNKGAGWWLRQLHRLADAVVSNSHTNRLMLNVEFPFLKPKLATIYNVVDMTVFCPPGMDGTSEKRAFRIVIAAGYHEKKNMLGVAKALLVLKKNQNFNSVVVDWFGSVQNDPTPFEKAQKFVTENGLEGILRFQRATRDIAHEFLSADAVGLFSFFEGLPNVVCEGMACGKPILLSSVCDASSLVENGKNGFLCNPNSPDSIVNAIQLLLAMSQSKRGQMGRESRLKAEQLFSENVIVDRYERVLGAAIRGVPVPPDCTWPAGAPDSAVETVKRWAGDKLTG